MSLLTIIKEVCQNGGVDPPAAAFVSTEPAIIQMIAFSQNAAEEIIRPTYKDDSGKIIKGAQWRVLGKSTTITGNGAAQVYTMPADFSELSDGAAVTVASLGVTVRGGLSTDEWNVITPVQGTPRFFLLYGNKMELYPYLANGVTAKVSYMSKSWCSNGTGAWAADADTAVIPELLITKNTIWRWKRQNGMAYQEYKDEFNDAFTAYKDSDQRERMP